MIRRAVEAALTVARAGVTADPAVPPPVPLRRFLAFAKQTPRSLEAVARVVDTDPDFRARVAAEVDEDHVGRAGWLWLTRPDGWEDELAALEAESTARAGAAASEREERAATRRLAALESAAARAEAEAAARRADLEAARAELAAEREARGALERQVVELAARVEQLADERRTAVRNLKDTEARLVDRSTQLNASRARERALEAEVRARAAEGTGAAEGPGERSRGGLASTPAQGRDTEPDPAGGCAGATGAAVSRPGTAGPRQGSHDPPAGPARGVAAPAAVASEVARAAEAAASLAGALAAAAEALGAAGAGDKAGAAGRDIGGDGAAPAGTTPAGDDGGLPPGRVPLALPGGMFDDSVEAAEHLLRAPAAVLVVDGYNVTMTGWPELDGPAQRRRLLGALSDLALRTSTAVDLVFDGSAEVEPRSPPPAGRPMVRVRFSPPGVEADDVIIDLVGQIPAATPVIVASSDKRVREAALRRGANLLHARQLVAVLRR